MPIPFPEEWITCAQRLADASAEAIAPYLGQHGIVDLKSDNSPVTRADRAAEKAMRDILLTELPEHGIIGEEYGEHHPPRTGADYQWVLDPIDGTRAFIEGKNAWGTLIALCCDGNPILGILNQPMTGERWLGIRGYPTQFRAHHTAAWDFLTTRPCPTLAEAEISTTSDRYFTPEESRWYSALAASCAVAHREGDCYAYGLLSRGQRDIVIDAGLKPYDILALVPIIEGAGGSIHGWNGAPVTLTNSSHVIALGDPTLVIGAP